MKDNPDKNANQLAKDHDKILKDNKSERQVEWREFGDNFQKFTMYKNYTPVEISNNTKLINHP